MSAAIRQLQQASDIYIDDLDATLEAHRATNRAKIIRRVEADPDPGVKSLILGETAIDPSAPLPNQPTKTRHAFASTFSTTKGSATDPRDTRIVKVDAKDAPQDPNGSPPRVDRVPKPWDYWPAGTIQHSKLYQGRDKAPKGSVQEYRPRVFAPDGNWSLQSKKKVDFVFRPWLSHLNGPEGDALQRLSDEIKAFEKYMALSREELNTTRRIAFEAKSLIHSTLDDVSCTVIGSYSTGLALPFSDIDIAVSFPAVEAEAATHRKSPRGLKFQKVYRKALFQIHRAIGNNVNFSSPELVFAQIPIVRAIHRKTEQEIQIQIQASVNLQQQHTLAYQAEYPSLHPLYVVIRSCLEMRGLTMPYEGGLGSYPILISIVNALKHASGQHHPHDLASQLLHVLKFYESKNLYRYGFSVDPPHLFRKDKKSMAAEERLTRATDPVLSGVDSMAKFNPLRPYLLCLQDPADPKNDLGRKAYAIKHIQRTFADARRSMLEAMEIWDRQSNKSFTSVGLLDALIHANYWHFQSARTKLARSINPGSHNRGTMSAREMLEKVIKIDRRKAAKAVAQKHRDSPPQHDQRYSDIGEATVASR
ncbi:MAG: hypothetical protein L6R38_004062 [Xanthoria sp. 2 TBL-2021]|nr:MAG: hypothetical protein L6R38_004062 [Xanthoria sp. 2 TBL-2021]